MFKGKLYPAAICLLSCALWVISIPAYAQNAKRESELDQQEGWINLIYNQHISEGVQNLEQREYSKAEYSFRIAQALLPLNPDAYINLGVVYIKRGETATALRILEEAETLILRHNPNQAILFYNLALCYFDNADYARSEKYFSKSLAVDPDLFGAKKGLAMSKERLKETVFVPQRQERTAKKRPSEATLALNRLEKESKDPVYLANKLLDEGSIAFKNNNIQGALNLIKKSVVLNPENPIAHYRLGLIYARQRRFKAAAESFNEAIILDPLFIKAHVNLGSAYGKLKEYDSALNVLKKALNLDKDNARVHYNLGMTYAALGKKSMANRYIRKAKKIAVKNNDTELLRKMPKGIK